MLKYRGRDGDDFRIEDTDDGSIESVDGKLLRDALFKLGIDGCFVDEEGNVTDEFGFVLVKAPPHAGKKQQPEQGQESKE